MQLGPFTFLIRKYCFESFQFILTNLGVKPIHINKEYNDKR